MSKQSDLVTVARDAGASGYVNVAGDTMTGRLVVNDTINADTSYPFAIQNGSQEPWYLRSLTTSNTFAVHRNGLGDVIRCDSSGRVTMPYQPAFSAYFSIDPPVSYTAGGRLLNFTVVSYNVGNHYDGTNKFTAPIAGRYMFLVDRALNTYGANQVIRHPSMIFEVNGTNVYSVNTGVSTSSAVASSAYTHFTVSMATVLNLNANDYVQVYFNYDNNPSTLYEYGNNYFTGYLLG